MRLVGGYALPAPVSVLVVESSSPSIRLAEHLTALRAWCTRCLPVSAWSVKIRHAPSRQCRGARDNNNVKTTTVHGMSTYPLHPPLACFVSFVIRTQKYASGYHSKIWCTLILLSFLANMIPPYYYNVDFVVETDERAIIDRPVLWALNLWWYCYLRR